MPHSSKPCGHLLLGVSGSVHCIHVPSYLIEFRRSFCESLRVIMTSAAAQMIEPRILGLYCDEPVAVDMWGTAGGSMAPHVRLTQWADLFVVVPATGNTLAKAAHGIADNLLTSAIAASEDRVVFAPAMSAATYESPATGRNIRQLEEDGHYVYKPEAVTGITSGDFAPGYGPSVEGLLSHMWHVLMRRKKEAGWEAAVSTPPSHPSGDVAMPVPVVRQRPAPVGETS